MDNKSKIEKTLFESLKKLINYIDTVDQNKTLEASLKTAQKNLEYTKAKRKRGSSSLIDFYDAKSKFLKAKEKLISGKEKEVKLSNEVKVKFFASSDAILNISEVDAVVELEENKEEDEIIKEVLNSKYDSQSKRLEVEKSKKSNLFANADLIPSLDLDFNYESNGVNSTYDQANKQVFERKYISWKLGATLETDIFRYSAKGAKKMGQLQLQQAKIKEKQYKHETILDIKSILKRISTQSEIVKALKESWDAEKVKIKYFRKRYKIGSTSIIDLHREEEKFERSEIEYKKSLNKQKVNILEYYYKRGDLLAFLIK